MVDSFLRIRQFIDDLKSSWYFKVWLLMWLVCAIMSFVSLIYFAEQANDSDNHTYQRVYFSSESSMKFPTYHFRTNGLFNITSVNCSHLTGPVKTQSCKYYKNQQDCVAVDGPSVTAYNKASEPRDNQRIDCTIFADVSASIAAGNPLTDQLIAWELDALKDNIQDSYFTIWIQPASWAWVLLQKNEGDGHTFWFPNLLYHTYIADTEYGQGAETAVFQISSIINSFDVFSLEQREVVKGWNTPSNTGGFAFFTLILHSIVMFLVAFLLPNNSKFLTGVNSSQ